MLGPTMLAAPLLATPFLARTRDAAPIRIVINGMPGSTFDILCRSTTARLRDLGLEPTGGTPAELLARIQTNRQHWAPVIAASGLNGDEP